MATSCQRLLSLLRANKILNVSNSGKLWARHSARNSQGHKNESISSEPKPQQPDEAGQSSNSQGHKNESNSSDPKPQQPDETDVPGPLTAVKSVWTVPIPENNLPDPVINSEREYFQSFLDPKHMTLYEGKYYPKRQGITTNMYAWLHWDININDNEEIFATMNRFKFKQHKLNQRVNDERVGSVGYELSAAHFILSRGGAVKFTGREHWYAQDSKQHYSIPTIFVDNLFVEAIDASKMKLTYVAFDNFEELSHLRYLRLNNCQYIDDYCLSRLQRVQHSLEFLDISNCPGVTDNGLASLQCLRKLKVLRLSNLTNVKHLGLLTLLLEEMIQDVVILGVTDEDLKPSLWKHRGERRLVRAFLGYLDEDDGDVTGKVKELPSQYDQDYNDLMKRHIRQVD